MVPPDGGRPCSGPGWGLRPENVDARASSQALLRQGKGVIAGGQASGGRDSFPLAAGVPACLPARPLRVQSSHERASPSTR